MANFAAFERLLGPRLHQRGEIYWRQVRTAFFRPIAPFVEYQRAAVRPPTLGRIGGIQYGVAPTEKSNSRLNCLMFDEAAHYSVEVLDQKRKRQVRLAGKAFEIRPISTGAELKRAYRPYLSFHERTGYKYGSQRKDAGVFDLWADELLQIPHLHVLGAYRAEEIVGASVSVLLDATVIYAMFFCDSAAVRECVSDLMLHAVRESAAATVGVRRVFAGLHKGQQGLDGFYRLRGATIYPQPAMLRLNPLARVLLPLAARGVYLKMLGQREGAA